MSIDTKTPNRGAVKPGKVQVNWRIDARALDHARVAAPELGFFSVPQMINFILIKVLTNTKIKKIVFGGP